QRQVDAAVAAGDGEPHAMLVGGGDLYLAPLPRRRLGGVLDEVQKHLDQKVAVAVHRRQRGIVILDEAHMPGEARLRHQTDAIQHLVDVDGLPLERPLVGEHLHAVDQRADASGFFTSCASIAAIAVTDRAALRCVSWRSILCAMVRSCSVTTTCSRSSATGAACTVTICEPRRGVSRTTPYSETLCPLWRTLSMSAKTGLSGGSKCSSGPSSKVAALASKNCSAAALA